MSQRLSITRIPKAQGFEYRRRGEQLTKRADIARIEALAIPPAWTDVEISSSSSAKVQARGRDAAGRVQIIYHPSFRRRQDREKFARAERFGKALPKLRAQVDRDLRRRKLNRKRVAACVVHLMDEQLFRVGNQQYADANGSFGITTLRKKHLRLRKNTVHFAFVGKSGTSHRKTVRDPRATRILEQLMELPGPAVFQFLEDDDAAPHPLSSADVNAYIRKHLGKSFSAKDFRTWGATVFAVQTLLDLDPADLGTKSQRAAAVRTIVKEVAQQLGNTESVAKSSYIDPRVLEAAAHPRRLKGVRNAKLRSAPYRTHSEQRTIALLERS